MWGLSSQNDCETVIDKLEKLKLDLVKLVQLVWVAYTSQG